MKTIYDDDYFLFFGGEEIDYEKIKIGDWICLEQSSKSQNVEHIRTFFANISGAKREISSYENTYIIEAELYTPDNNNVVFPSWIEKLIQKDNYTTLESERYHIPYNRRLKMQISVNSEYDNKTKKYETDISSLSVKTDMQGVKRFPRLLVNKSQYEMKLYQKNIQKQLDELKLIIDQQKSSIEQTIEAINDTRKHLETIEEKFDVQFVAAKNYYRHLGQLKSDIQ